MKTRRNRRQDDRNPGRAEHGDEGADVVEEELVVPAENRVDVADGEPGEIGLDRLSSAARSDAGLSVKQRSSTLHSWPLAIATEAMYSKPSGGTGGVR